MRPRAERRRSSDAIENSSGFALAGALIFLFVLGIIGISFFAMAGYETRASQQDLDSQRAFWLAEGGRERTMKALKVRNRPPDSDTQIFSNVSGPTGGTYSVMCLVDTSALFSVEKAFMLDCVGESGGRQRHIRQRIKMISFAKYGYFTDDEVAPGGTPIWFATGNVIEGLIHSNGVFKINGTPQFLGKVTSAADHMTGSVNNSVYGPTGWPVAGNNPYFQDSFELNTSNIPLPTETADLFDAATNFGVFNAPATTIELGVSGNGAGVAAPGWFRYQQTPPPASPNWTSVQISTLAKPVFYCNNDIRVDGVLDGELTISGKKNIWIVDDITYAASDANGQPLPGCNDLLGILAEDNILFEDNAPTTDNLKVDAVLMALGTSITAESWNSGVTHGTLTIWGGLIQKYRGPVGQIDGSGALVSGYNKNYHYDPRVTARTPPEFPLTGVYEEVAWQETRDDSDPF